MNMNLPLRAYAASTDFIKSMMLSRVMAFAAALSAHAVAQVTMPLLLQYQKNLNAKLQSEHRFRDKQVTLNLRENDIDGWKSEMSLSLDNIPLDNAGFGTQNMVKTEMFMQQNIDVDILIIEEPENNLSYTNMSILISRLSENTLSLESIDSRQKERVKEYN